MPTAAAVGGVTVCAETVDPMATSQQVMFAMMVAMRVMVTAKVKVRPSKAKEAHWLRMRRMPTTPLNGPAPKVVPPRHCEALKAAPPRHCEAPKAKVPRHCEAPKAPWQSLPPRPTSSPWKTSKIGSAHV